MQEFTDQMPSDITRFPMVPIRDVVIFPFTKVAFKIGRPSSVRALEQAMTASAIFFSPRSTTRRLTSRTPNKFIRSELWAEFLQAQKQENGQIKVVVEGRERGQAVRFEQDDDGMFYALVAGQIN
jgi:ATP-dependent Lon protease